MTITETAPEVVEQVAIATKKKLEKTGNLLLDISNEVDSMSKTKALNEAERLAENIEVNYFKLGGILNRINDEGWFEGFANFDEYVVENFGFAGRKARYLIEIYTNLVDKQIPWEKVSNLGWTKLTRLCKVLTPENTDEWVAKVEKLTVAELDALLKAPEGETTTAKTTDEVVKMTFKFKPSEAEVVKSAISKAKDLLHTEFDTVAVESIMVAYAGTQPVVPSTVAIEDFINSIGFEPLLQKISELYPLYDITVTAKEVAPEAEVPEEVEAEAPEADG